MLKKHQFHRPAQYCLWKAFCDEAPKIEGDPQSGQGTYVFTKAYSAQSAQKVIAAKVRKMLGTVGIKVTNDYFVKMGPVIKVGSATPPARKPALAVVRRRTA